MTLFWCDYFHRQNPLSRGISLVIFTVLSVYFFSYSNDMGCCFVGKSISTALSAGSALAATSAFIDVGGQTTRVDNGREYYPYTTKKRADAAN